MKTTTVFKKTITAFNTGVRRIVNMGGTSSSKTFSNLQLLLLIAQKRDNASISVVSETLPHLKLGAIRDFESILKADGLFNEEQINRTDHTYHFGSSYIEFFAADQAKATGPRRNILYLNECNNIPYSIVSELEQRTDQVIFYDFNPTAEFWIIDKVFALPDVEYSLIKSNYRDNEYLSDSIRKEVELKASISDNFKRIHIDVEFGNYEGIIFPDWKMCDAMPESNKRSYGMDFGFTNDPTTLVDVRYQDGQLWADLLLYKTGLTPEGINDELRSIGIDRRTEIIADNNEPRMIDYLFRRGYNIKPTIKGPDSIRVGIELIKQVPLNITKRSVELIREVRGYKFKQDKNGLFLNEPASGQSDHAIDSVRYGGQVLLSSNKIQPAKWNFAN